jgi:hypothetical protein
MNMFAIIVKRIHGTVAQIDVSNCTIRIPIEMMLPTPVIPTAAKEEQGKSSRLPDNGHFL